MDDDLLRGTLSHSLLDGSLDGDADVGASTRGAATLVSPSGTTASEGGPGKLKSALVVAAEQLDRSSASLMGSLRKHNSQGRWQKRHFESAWGGRA